MLTADEIRANAEEIRERIDAAARRVGRSGEDVRLVAVTKTHPPEVVVEAVRAGLTTLGENRVQEARAKRPAVERLLSADEASADAGSAWHLIGHLQRNKARAAAATFDMVESVDSVRLAQALAAAVPDGTVVPVLLEVYVGDDPERPGLRLHEVADAAAGIVALPTLEVRGLMAVAPLGWEGAAARRAFEQVRELRDILARQFPGVHWAHLSMGMSDDFEQAVEAGSTMVRIGRALFGARDTR